MDPKEIRMPVRLLIYLAGIVTVSLGIVLCKKCSLGISPISSVPFVLEMAVPLSFGTLTMLFHLANTLIQVAMERRLTGKLLLQVPVAVVFGQVINLLQRLLAFEASALPCKLLCLALSVFFTALGMIFMLKMALVQNPPDGTVHKISQILGRELGQVKIVYDIFCVLLSVLLSLALLGRAEGFGLATVVSALFVGKLVTWMSPPFISLFSRLAAQ